MVLKLGKRNIFAGGGIFTRTPADSEVWINQGNQVIPGSVLIEHFQATATAQTSIDNTWTDITDMTVTFTPNLTSKGIVFFSGKFQIDPDVDDLGTAIRVLVNDVVVDESVRYMNEDYYVGELFGTRYLNIPGTAFLPRTETTKFTRSSIFDSDAVGQISLVEVDLPDGATITGCVVYGNDTNRTWTLYRRKLDASAGTDNMASAAIDTEDTTISNPTFDNEYGYFLYIGGLESGDEIHGARIKYTIDDAVYSDDVYFSLATQTIQDFLEGTEYTVKVQAKALTASASVYTAAQERDLDVLLWPVSV